MYHNETVFATCEFFPIVVNLICEITSAPVPAPIVAPEKALKWTHVMPPANLFTAHIASSEVRRLRLLSGLIQSHPVKSREQFLDLVNAIFGVGILDPKAFANDMGYSISSVYRWIDGASAPHQSIWSKVEAWILDAIRARIESLEPQAGENEQ